MAAANRAVGYEMVGGSFRVRPLSTTKANALVGAGGLCSNATDLVQWMRALIDGKVFRPSVHRCGFATRVRTNSRRRSLARAASGSSRPRVPLSASTGNGLNCGRSGAVFSRVTAVCG